MIVIVFKALYDKATPYLSDLQQLQKPKRLIETELTALSQAHPDLSAGLHIHIYIVFFSFKVGAFTLYPFSVRIRVLCGILGVLDVVPEIWSN